MGLADLHVEGALHDGDIEAPAIIGDNYLISGKQFREAVEIVALDKGEYLPAVIEGDSGDGTMLSADTCCFDIDERCCLLEMGEDAPMLAGW